MTERIEALYQAFVKGPTANAPIRRVVMLGAVVVRELIRDQVHVRAATLGYWSLVGIVPALVLAAAVTQAFGVGESTRGVLLSALLAGAVQNVGETVDGWLARVDLAGLGVVGTVAVAVTASRIYFSVEEAYNRLWNVRMRRSLVLRLVIFYAGLTLAPVLIALGFALTNRVQDEVGVHFLAHAFPTLLTATAFVGAIRTLPDTDVRWGPALIGGLTSAVAFEVAKIGFNAYVNVLGGGSAAAAIYGSLALFPVFLLWLYVLWMIVLFGVELAFVVQRRDELLVAEQRRLMGDAHARRHADALFGLQCLLVVAERFRAGHGPTSEPEVTRVLQSEPEYVLNALETLEEAGVLAESPQGYLPSRPLGQVELRGVLQRYRACTAPLTVEGSPGEHEIAELLGPGRLLDRSVEELLAKAEPCVASP